MDRNGIEVDGVSYDVWSLSARRAWIEIRQQPAGEKQRTWSLSARRAWIEIIVSVLCVSLTVVALRKESVDRNAMVGVPELTNCLSLSARRAWIEI